MKTSRKFPYDQTFAPAFPILELSLHAPLETVGTDTLQALIDTGADGTLVPRKYLLQIDAPLVGEVDIVSHWGDRRPAMLYEVDIRVAHLTLPGIFVVADDFGEWVVLGRDVLNRLCLVLDGPAAITRLLGS